MALRSVASPNGPQQIPSSDSRKSNRKDTNKLKDGISLILDMISVEIILMVLATIVAAVTFVMGFTCTKLYMSSAPDWVRAAIFTIFVLCNSIPMLTSVVAVMFLILAKLQSDLIQGIFPLLKAMGFLRIASRSMVVAFIVGVCLVVTLLP